MAAFDLLTFHFSHHCIAPLVEVISDNEVDQPAAYTICLVLVCCALNMCLNGSAQSFILIKMSITNSLELILLLWLRLWGQFTHSVIMNIALQSHWAGSNVARQDAVFKIMQIVSYWIWNLQVTSWNETLQQTRASSTEQYLRKVLVSDQYRTWAHFEAFSFLNHQSSSLQSTASHRRVFVCYTLRSTWRKECWADVMPLVVMVKASYSVSFLEKVKGLSGVWPLHQWSKGLWWKLS